MGEASKAGAWFGKIADVSCPQDKVATADQQQPGYVRHRAGALTAFMEVEESMA